MTHPTKPARHLLDITGLLIEVTGLYRALIAARLEAANHLAAIRAALSAAEDGEPDPLAYLRDELSDCDSGEWRL
jgi:predicted benzoate:H+ symporter BenE